MHITKMALVRAMEILEEIKRERKNREDRKGEEPAVNPQSRAPSPLDHSR